MSHPHWQYFLSVEEDLLQCARFVEFDQQNFQTYSVQFARVIVAAAAEFDAVAKALCNLIEPTSRPQSINAYHPIVVGTYPKFIDYTIHVPRAKLQFQPWQTWTAKASPNWWSKGYNKIKHERDQHFSAANLGNALQAVAGLLVGIAYLYDRMYGSVPRLDLELAPKLFEPQDHPGSMQTSNLGWSCKVWK